MVQTNQAQLLHGLIISWAIVTALAGVGCQRNVNVIPPGEPPPSPSWPKEVKVSNVKLYVQGRPITQLGMEEIQVTTNDTIAVRVEFATDKRILHGSVECRTPQGVIAQTALCRVDQPSLNRTVLAADVPPIKRPGTYRLRVLAFSTLVIEQPVAIREP
ncbi:MAG: hypothetical protein KatS3mg110_0170 [Pirellulaceae bacterium]|nr:MAG: hypothetical protein KatS3mg110_0170 [Pirellulaceae bacterium]